MDESNLSKAEQERQTRVSSARRRKIKKIVVWILAVILIAAAVYGLVLWSKKSAQNKPGVAVEVMTSRDHIPPNAPKPDYNSNPPTSGPHYPVPPNSGIYYNTPRR